MEWIHTFYVYANFVERCYDSKSHCMFLHLLYYGFRTRRFWIAIFCLVKSQRMFAYWQKIVIVVECYRFPFDWKNPIGYLMALALMYLVLKCLYFFGAVGSSLEITSYLLMMEFMKDVQNDIKLMNEIAKSNKNLSEMLKQLRVSIEFHSNMKKLS